MHRSEELKNPTLMVVSVVCPQAGEHASNAMPNAIVNGFLMFLSVACDQLIAARSVAPAASRFRSLSTITRAAFPPPSAL